MKNGGRPAAANCIENLDCPRHVMNPSPSYDAGANLLLTDAKRSYRSQDTCGESFDVCLQLSEATNKMMAREKKFGPSRCDLVHFIDSSGF
jgi:hypothetical protein